MPSSIVKSYAKQSGKTVAKVEEMWDEIKKYVNKKYPKLAKARKFAYIVSVLGKKLGIKKTKKIKESSGILKLGQLLIEAEGGIHEDSMESAMDDNISIDDEFESLRVSEDDNDPDWQLIDAAYRGTLDDVKLAIKNGADGDISMAFARKCAAVQGDVDLLNYIAEVEGSPIDENDLCYAIISGDIKLIKYIVSKGVNEPEQIESALECAKDNGNDEDIIAYLQSLIS